MILYRAVGMQELELIYDGDMKAFPARLPQQPIFYPVLQLEYARQVASDWNVRSGQFAGYVTQFKVEDDYISQFEEHVVGESQYQEFWIPAEDIEEFNKHIVGHIKVVEAYFGDGFQGFIPDKSGLQGQNAVAQFTMLANSYVYKRMDFYLEIKRNHKAVYLNYPFWLNYDFKNQGLKGKVLQAIKEAWLTSFPKNPLPVPPPQESIPARPTSSQPVEDVVDDDLPRVHQIDPQEPVQSIPEKNTPKIQNDSSGSRVPVPEQKGPNKIIPSEPLEYPIPRTTTYGKQPKAFAFVRPFREERAPVKPTESHFVQGIKFGLSGAYGEAVGELIKAVQEHPLHAAAHTSLGVAFHALGEDDRALSSYETALKADPKYAEAHYFRANILHSRGDVREAMDGYTIALGLHPELINAHGESVPQDRLTDYAGIPANMYRITRSAQRVLELGKAIEANPQDANLFKERAAEYSRLQNFERAIADYNSFLKMQPDDANVLHARGIAYEQIGEHERAKEDFQKVNRVDPSLSNLYINRGIAFGKMGNYRQSIASLTEGIRLAPENANSYFNRGTTFFYMGDFESAIVDFSNVIRLVPGDDAAYYWRGISHEEAGHQNDAISDYRQFLVLSQDQNAREDVEQKLGQLEAAIQNDMGAQNAGLANRQKTNQVQPEKGERIPDLYDILLVLGDRALNSTWFGSSVDCRGDRAEELYSLTDQNRPIEGHDMLDITVGIHGTTKGDFEAYDSDSADPWVFIRAWNGSGFYLESNDRRTRKKLKSRFQNVEDVESSNSSYEALFIHI